MSPERKDLAEMLIQNLWTAMIAGPEMEDEVWIALQTIGKLDDDSIQFIKDIYFDQMKPVVNEEERAALRHRYRLERKRQT